MRVTDKNDMPSVMEFLNTHKMDSLNLLGYIKNADPIVYINDNLPVDCVVLKDKNSNMFFINAYSDASIEEAVRDIFSKTEKVFFSGVREEIAQKLMRMGNMQGNDTDDLCLLYYYPYGSIDERIIPDFMGTIKHEDIGVVDYFYTYRSSDSFDKICHEVTTRPTSAAYIDGEIAAWSLLHEDNSMGAMFTKPQFRNRNLAIHTTNNMIKNVLARGDVPYVHIVSVNTPSIKLAEKIGLKYAYDVRWFECEFK